MKTANVYQYKLLALALSVIVCCFLAALLLWIARPESMYNILRFQNKSDNLLEIEYWIETDVLSGRFPIELDSGHTLIVNQFFIVTPQVTLRPCPQQADISWSLLSNAYAGHRIPTDISQIAQTKLVNLLKGERASLGRRPLSKTAYCQILFLIGPNLTQITNINDAMGNMGEHSLILNADLFDSKNSSISTISIKTGFSFTNNQSIQPSAIFTQNQNVVFKWKLSDVLRSIDFRESSQKTLQRQLLRSVIENQQVVFE